VRDVFPAISNVTSGIGQNNTATIRIWNHDRAIGRGDLAIPLNESGSGIGQVLAMLYVVVTAQSPRTIIIDEPQSFLHPGAVRRLFEIFLKYPQHQYLITTHMPSGLGSIPIASMILLSKERGETRVRELDTARRADITEFLGAVGARLSDVFGTDKILWVEGATEEACFPLVVRALMPDVNLGNLQILGVVNTGELEGRNADRVFSIYERLSSGHTVLPDALAFVYDREGKSPRLMEDLTRRAGGMLHWLERRMFECYLLDPLAIADLLSNLEERNFSQEEVAMWLQRNGANKKYFPDGMAKEPSTPEWVTHVHAGKLLQDLFEDMTENRQRYEKVMHGIALTEASIARATPSIQELAVFLRTLLTPFDSGLVRVLDGERGEI
jgi:hypothetical protein